MLLPTNSYAFAHQKHSYYKGVSILLSFSEIENVFLMLSDCSFLAYERRYGKIENTEKTENLHDAEGSPFLCNIKFCLVQKSMNKSP